MDVLAGDYDGDGDVHLTEMGPDRLYRNDDGRFVELAEREGLGGRSWATRAACLDYDLDGDLDLFSSAAIAWASCPWEA